MVAEFHHNVRPHPKNRRRKRLLWGSSKAKTRPCYYCGQSMKFTEATVDHKEPLSRGGTNAKKNTVLACKDCNSAKNDLTSEEFFRLLQNRSERPANRLRGGLTA